MVLSWYSWNWPLTKRSTRLDLPTADSPSSTSLNWQILLCVAPLGRWAPPLPAITAPLTSRLPDATLRCHRYATQALTRWRSYTKNKPCNICQKRHAHTERINNVLYIRDVTVRCHRYPRPVLARWCNYMYIKIKRCIICHRCNLQGRLSLGGASLKIWYPSYNKESLCANTKIKSWIEYHRCYAICENTQML